MIKTIIFALLLTSTAHSHLTIGSEASPQAVFADLEILKQSKVPILYSSPETNVGYAILTSEMLNRMSALAHEKGRCGNFEALSEIPKNLTEVQKQFEQLRHFQIQNQNYENLALTRKNLTVQKNPKITEAMTLLSSDNIRSTVEWLSSFPSRYNKGNKANIHVQEMANRLKELVRIAKYPVTVELITHRSTPQKSIRVSIKGKSKPQEYIILGGHLDSINGWGSSSRPAPGADDNASGSASLLEALNVLLKQHQPERTVEFFWYAGEESGLLGSAEIADSYKNENRNVIAVLQLDMTMFAGDGENKITSISDFTSAWLRDYLKALNTTYLNVEILDDQCGYGCSDHASWHRRGYPTLMPTEAKFNSMFQDIHTDKDVISPVMSFQHALIFSKIALAIAMDLGNSDQHEPTF